MAAHDSARQRRARVLAAEVALLTAEVKLLEDLIAAGIMPKGARRQPTAGELRAGVRFAELDRIVVQAAGLIVRHTDRVRDHVLDGLVADLGQAGADPWEALAQLDAYRDPSSGVTIPGLAGVVDDTAATIADDLTGVAYQGAAEAMGEAARQGIPDAALPTLDAAANPATRAAAQAHAARIAQAPATRLLNVAAEAGQRAATVAGATGATVLEAALNAAELTDRAGVEDLARQGANVTHGLGRTEALTALDQAAAPAEVYASELLDSATCGPCAEVDGRTYDSLDSGLEDYPGAGGYIGCDGGSRCRGTLVVVHNTEAPPTLNTPGDGRPGPGGVPPDRTPRGPSGVPRPSYLDPAGNIIPAPIDKGVPAAIVDTPTPGTLGTDGRTTIPTDLEPEVTPVAPADVGRDPELAQFSDDELDAVLLDDTASMDQRMAAADELDQRAAGTRSRVYAEEELDDATLAAYEADREAWERAGGYAADDSYGTGAAASKPAGRKIDRVRQEWADQLHMDYLAAEDATRGTLVRRELEAEYRAKYGTSTAALMEGPARVAYHYASRELRDHWEAIGGRKSFSEFAVERGVADAKMTERARKAALARDDAVARADQSAAGNLKRAKAKAERAKQRRRPLSAGDRLARDQARRDRIRAQERRNAAEFNRLRDEFGPDTPPPPPPEA